MRAVGILFLAFQLLAIVYNQFSPGGYFAWAPYQSYSEFRIEARINDIALNSQKCWERYHFKCDDVTYYPMSQTIAAVQQYEETYGRNEEARVTIRYSTNGHALQVWEWLRK